MENLGAIETVSSSECSTLAELEDYECMAWEQQRNRLSRFGFVAFMDLLGFSQIAKQDDEKVIKSIFSIIKHCQKEAKDELDKRDADDVPCYFSESSNYSEIEVSLISDSIVLHWDFPDATFEPDIRAYWFVRFVRRMFSDLLRKELPSRCAIAYGKYYWDSDTRSIMAGSALIEAHIASEHIAFPGIVCCESLMKKWRKSFDDIAKCFEGCKIIAYDFDVPLKGWREHKSKKGSIVIPDLTRDEIGDPAKFIRQQFESYSKPVPEKFSSDLKSDDRETLYKLDKSTEVFRRLYAD